MVNGAEFNVKKKSWGRLDRSWTEPDVRDNVMETIMELAKRTGIGTKELLRYGRIPRANWLLEEEKQSIIGYAKNHMEEGYRRLTYMMIDENIAYSSPSSVYRVLKEAGLLMRFAPFPASGLNDSVSPLYVPPSYINTSRRFQYHFNHNNQDLPTQARCHSDP